MTHYIHDEKNNRIEGMSKEEIYALLAAAIQQGQLPSVDEDTAFVTMFKSIVDGNTYKIGFCTQAQYNQLEAQGLIEGSAYYVITDDTSYDDLIASINSLNTADASLQAAINALESAKVNISKTKTYPSTGQSYTGEIVNADGVISLNLIDNTYDEFTIITIANDDIYIKHSFQGVIDYEYSLISKISEIDTRLDELGFKSGVSTYSGLTLNSGATLTNTLKKQGKYCIFNLYGTKSSSLIPNIDLVWTAGSNVTITIPSGFRPKTNTTIVVGTTLAFASGVPFTATVTTSGTISFTAPSDGYFSIVNVGWELA